jgi:hypothetical protein
VSACSLIWFRHRPSGHKLLSDRHGAVAGEIRGMPCTEILRKRQEAETGGAAESDRHRRDEVRNIEHAQLPRRPS